MLLLTSSTRRKALAPISTNPKVPARSVSRASVLSLDAVNFDHLKIIKIENPNYTSDMYDVKLNGQVFRFLIDRAVIIGGARPSSFNENRMDALFRIKDVEGLRLFAQLDSFEFPAGQELAESFPEAVVATRIFGDEADLISCRLSKFFKCVGETGMPLDFHGSDFNGHYCRLAVEAMVWHAPAKPAEKIPEKIGMSYKLTQLRIMDETDARDGDLRDELVV